MLVGIWAARRHLQEGCWEVCAANSAHHSSLEGSLVTFFPWFWVCGEMTALQQWKKSCTSDSPPLPLWAVVVTASSTTPKEFGGHQDHQCHASCDTRLQVSTGLEMFLLGQLWTNTSQIALHFLVDFGVMASLVHSPFVDTLTSLWSANMRIVSSLVLLSNNAIFYRSCCLLIHETNTRWLCNVFIMQREVEGLCALKFHLLTQLCPHCDLCNLCF